MFKTITQGCIVCTLKSLHQFTIFFGCSTLTWKCPHTRKKDINDSTVFYNSVSKHIWSGIICTILITDIIFVLSDIWWHAKIKSRTIILYNISSTFFVIGAFFSVLSSTIQSSKRIEELNGIVDILKNTRNYKMDAILSKDAEQRIKRFIRIAQFTISIMLILAIVTKTMSNVRLNQSLTIFKTFVLVYSIGVIICDALNFFCSIQIYLRIFERITQHIQQILNDEIDEIQLKNTRIPTFNSKQINTSSSNIRSSNQITNLHIEFAPLHIKLQQIRRLYLATVLNVKQMNYYYNPTKLVHHLMAGVTLIFNIYIAIMEQVERGRYQATYAALSGLLGCSTIVVISWKFADFLILKATEIIPFLYTYPISKLDQQSASEVEMIIDTLSVRLPIITASGLYQISTRLLASMSGTIVTYVLVAMQFKIELNEG